MSEDVTVTLDWSDADNVLVKTANVVMIQGMPAEVVLSFGYAPPPIAIATMSGEEATQHLQQHQPKVQQITRIAMPFQVAKAFAKNLMTNLGDHPEPGVEGTS